MNRCVEITLHKKRCKKKTNNIYCNVHNPECVICLTPIIDILTLQCNHRFCKKCIYEWICISHNSCPLCRRVIIEEEKMCAFDWGIKNFVLSYGIEYTFGLSILSPEDQDYFMEETGILKYKGLSTYDLVNCLIKIQANEYLSNIWISITETVKGTFIIMENKNRLEQKEYIDIFVFI